MSSTAKEASRTGMGTTASEAASDAPLDGGSSHPEEPESVDAAEASTPAEVAGELPPPPEDLPSADPLRASDAGSAAADAPGDPEIASELEPVVHADASPPVDAPIPGAVAAPPSPDLPASPERPRPLWRRIAEGVAPVLVAVLVAVVFMSLKTDRGYRYHASSTYPGYKQDGWTGRIASADIFFSTNNEMNPWVSIDLGEIRTVHRVKVTNRTDFPERAVPLVVEVEEPDGTFREVARREKKFAKWTFEFPPESTRHVRLRVDGRSTFLHLARVLID